MIFRSQQEFEVFQEAMHHFQNASWAEGHALLDSLIERDPLNSDIRSLKSDMSLRERFEAQEIRENKILFKKKLTTTIVRSFILLMIVVVTVVLVVIYSNGMEETANRVHVSQEQTISTQKIDNDVKNALQLIEGGHFQYAKQMLQEVKVSHPDYPNIDLYIRQAEEIERYDAVYESANKAYAGNDFSKAYELYGQVSAWSPYYKDVKQKISQLETQFNQENLYQQAESDFAQGDYISAISMYEQIKSINPDFRTADIDDHLFQSYLLAAEAVVSQDTESLTALETAEIYFKKALSLRPQDDDTSQRRAKARKAFEVRLANSYVEQAQSALLAQADSITALKNAEVYLSKALELVPADQSIRNQRDLAGKYLQAMDSFDAGAYDDVIVLLEEVVKIDPDYASHTAAQGLYEAYMARARNSMAAGIFDSALSDLQKAVEITHLMPGAVMQEFEGQRRIADLLGLQGNYEDALLVFRFAIELSDFGNLIQENKPELITTLNKASELADAGKYRDAYLAYREILISAENFYSQTNYVVSDGDYLLQIARKYNTTVQAIMEANQIQATSLLNRQILIIPVFPRK